MNAYIISYNRLSPLLSLCAELLKRDCTPIIIDNDSSYPPLLEYFKWQCPFHLFTVPNTGSRSPWVHNIVKGDHYIVTDSDLCIKDVPIDMVEKMMEVLEENKTSVKVGLSLTIDDLPDNEYANKAKEYEQRFWVTKSGDHYSAPIDTTLALYSAKRMEKIKPAQFYNAIRLAPPYSAKHLPWYLTPETINEEELFYINSLKGNHGHWLHEYKRMHGNNTI